MARLELWYPIKNPFSITQKFGENLIPLYKELGMIAHNGIDAYGAEGQPIYAAHDGEVTFTGEDGSGGLGVVIRTLEPLEYKDTATGQAFFKTIYWHCQKGSFLVKPGDLVKAGEQIASCDNTGMSTGSHLHFGLKPIKPGEENWQWFNLEKDNGYMGAIDPLPYFNGYFAVDAPRVLGTMRTMIELLKKVVGLFGLMGRK